MPAKSKEQQASAGAALAAKRGEMAIKKLRPPARKMYESMTEDQIRKLAKRAPQHQDNPDTPKQAAYDAYSDARKNGAKPRAAHTKAMAAAKKAGAKGSGWDEATDAQDRYGD